MESIEIPAGMTERLAAGLGTWMSKLNKLDPNVLAADMLKVDKSYKHYEILSRYVDPKGKKILEVGCGYGTNLIVWTKSYGLDVTGVEPEGEGFAETLDVSSQLLKANGLTTDKIKAAKGEAIPFPDASFDIVYSANVLEHTDDPVRVLRECLRVLRPGGLIHFEIPNFLSFFEGHYYILMPPIWWHGLLPFWVKYVFGRDPAFARTLRTELNPVWLRRTIQELGREQPLELISLGEELFRERLRGASFNFEQDAAKSQLGGLMQLLLALNKGDWIANLFIALQAYYPIYMTVRKGA